MAIDDNTSYELTGAQVKDLAARIKGAAGAVIYYVGETFFTDGATGQSVYSDSALTTTVTATAMAAEAEAGKLLYLFELDSRNDVVSIHEISYVAPPGMDDGEFSILYGTSIWDIFYVPGDGWSVNEKPIPTVNNATLTIQHNGTNVQTFTANQSTNATANIETIWADDIAPATTVPSVETAMIADGAVTSAKLGASALALFPKKTLLASGGSKTTTTTNLSQAPSNFDFLLVDIVSGDGARQCVIIPATASLFDAASSYYWGGVIYFKVTQWTISGSTITRNSSSQYTSSWGTISSGDNHGIVNVYGIKY